MPVVIQTEWYTKEQIENNKDTFFVFGDNKERTGTGGQALHCRNQPNAIGIITKAKPTYNEDAFLSDDDLAYNCALITKDYLRVIYLLKQGKTIIFPADGIGTGRADLANKAPLTFMFVQTMWNYCLELSKELKTQELEKKQ